MRVTASIAPHCTRVETILLVVATRCNVCCAGQSMASPHNKYECANCMRAAPIGRLHAQFKPGAKYIMLNTCTRV